jgi:hypothetical protein
MYSSYFTARQKAILILTPVSEEAQCPGKAARKKKWAEYRQAKEATQGKPMR